MRWPALPLKIVAPSKLLNALGGSKLMVGLHSDIEK